MTTTSKYSIIGGVLLLLFLNISLTVVGTKLFLDELEEIGDFETALAEFFTAWHSLLFLTLWAFAFTLLNTECKRWKIDANGLSSSPFLFPFLKRHYAWKDFDFYMITEEYTRKESHEAIWLIKDRKLKARISSFYYSNYEELKSAIPISYKGKLVQPPLLQFLCLFGVRIPLKSIQGKNGQKL